MKTKHTHADKRASSGQIWRALNILMAKNGKERRVVVEKGEMVEFRFWHPAHFRTHDGLYLEVSENEFHKNFSYVGDIFDEVRWKNRHTTKQILDCKLYNEPEDPL